MTSDLAAFAQAIPSESSLWLALVERVGRWTSGSAGGPESPGSMLTFGPTQWRDYVVQATARRFKTAPPRARLGIDDLDWQGIDDMLQEVIDSGYPWIGLSPDGLVGLIEPGGDPWLALPDSDDAARPGGTWRTSP